MNNKHIILLFLSLLLGSFGDEAVQIIFALQLGDAERVYLTSALLLLGMLGGLCANVIYSRLAARFSARQLILFALFAQAVLVMVAATTALPAVYLTVSLMLGFLGGLLWSAVLTLIPVMSTDDKSLEQINKYAHSIRNMGFMAGPMLGGTFSYLFDAGRALLWVAVATSLSGMVIWLAMCGLARLPRPDSTPAINGLKSIGLLLQNKQILTAIAPLSVTVACTSALSVLLIVYLTDVVQLNGVEYGIFSSAISLALALCPLILAPILTKMGEVAAACLSAVMIGVSLLLLGITEQFYMLVVFGVMMGAFNGTQNTIMSAFMLKNIAAVNRDNYMPAYVLILQMCVVIGFLISMLVKSTQFTTAFFGLGGLTVVAGVLGFWVNWQR